MLKQKKLYTIFSLIDWSIYDKQKEKDYLYHYKQFLHILDLEKLFSKTVGALLAKKILDINIYQYLIDYYDFFWLVYLFDVK